MKKPKHILKSFFETSDTPTEEEFASLIDSFHHKDDGLILTKHKMDDQGNISFYVSDGVVLTIEKYIPATSKPITYIEGLQNRLEVLMQDISKKVDKENGKGLSQANFTIEEKEKLNDLENYIPAISQPISYIDGLLDFLNEMLQDISQKVDLVDGKGLSQANFTIEEKEKLARLTLQQHINTTYDSFRYVDTINNDFTNMSEVLEGLSSATRYYLVRTPNKNVYFLCKAGVSAIDELDNCRLLLINATGQIRNSPTSKSQYSTADYEVWNYPRTGISADTFVHNMTYNFSFWRLKIGQQNT